MNLTLRPILSALSALTLAASASAYNAEHFSTMAGTAPTSGSANGLGPAAAFFNPYGVAATSGGTVYVADTFNSAIRVITPSGSVSTYAGAVTQSGSTDSTTLTSARFSDPQGIAVDGSGNLYVADTFNDTIRKITPSAVTTLAGKVTTAGSTDSTTGGANARFKNPAAVAVDGSGNVYVADTGNNTIRKITSAAVVTTLAGTPLVAGSTDSASGSPLFDSPEGLAVDGTGNVYVADTFNFTIRKITPGGTVTTLAGTAGTSGTNDGTGAAAQFALPQGIAVGSDGNIYVTDSSSNTIRKVTPAGVVTTVGGTAGVTGSADGTSINAQFNLPLGIASDGTGHLYVADVQNNTIRKTIIVSVDGDFNGDANPDVLWQNTSTGNSGIYLMKGVTFNSWLSLGMLPTEWEMVGTGDFNGDGQTDIVWQNTTTGASGIYLMNGTTFVTWVDFNTVGTSWRISGVGDFNGDGQPDVLWRNTASGEAGVQLMNGTTFGAWVSFGVLPNVWKICGTGDFNGDGQTDIVWQNTSTGDSGIYLMNGASFGTWVDLNTHGTVWLIKGTGDFNQDGSIDVLWQNPNTQECGVYLMNGTVFGSWESLGVAGPDWTIRQ